MMGFDLPPPAECREIPQLPNPFIMFDGSVVSGMGDWQQRRREMLALLLYYQYGHMPPPPGNVVVLKEETQEVLDGRASQRRVTLGMGPGHCVQFRVALTMPSNPGPHPVVIKNDVALNAVPIFDELIERGYGAAEYMRTDLSPDDPDPDTVRLAAQAYPDYDWATLAMWAWGTHRVLDWLLTIDGVDADRIVATGHSRGGKTALLAGATDERIALTVPNGSGTGGAACYRVPVGETLRQITTNFPHWFHPRFAEFADREEHLPFDQHFLKALVAPRALLSVDAYGDEWANPPGTQETWLAAQEVYEWLGAPDMNGIYVREGGHQQSPDDWRTLLDFADKVFFAKTPESGKQFDRPPFPDRERTFDWRRPDQPPEQ